MISFNVLSGKSEYFFFQRIKSFSRVPKKTKYMQRLIAVIISDQRDCLGVQATRLGGDGFTT